MNADKKTTLDKVQIRSHADDAIGSMLKILDLLDEAKPSSLCSKDEHRVTVAIGLIKKIGAD